MRIFLSRISIHLSALTVHKYMNQELKLYSIVRRKFRKTDSGKPHKRFENLLQQDFSATQKNQKWCTDFTYVSLADGRMYYNCTILDLYDRSVVASITDKHITSDLAIRTLKKALAAQPRIRGKLLLHSDQGSQFTSHKFTEFCESVSVTQSMSRAGCPWQNAPMERYFNTLKSELIYLHHFHSFTELCDAIENFAYVWYNHVRPHSFLQYRTPFEIRSAS